MAGSVDDILLIWPHGRESLLSFVQFTNNIHPKIKLTMELESDNKLPFLDVLIEKVSNKLKFDVYRKATHTNRYLHAESHHHPSQLSGILKTLHQRAKDICSKENLPKEKQRLNTAFKANGFSNNQIQKVLKTKKQNKKDNEIIKGHITLPYIKGTTDRLGLC